MAADGARRRYHRHYGNSGHVWEGRFKAFPVQDDDHLVTALRYVERNALRAELVSRAEDWKWSSLACTPQAVELDLSDFHGRVPIELDGHTLFPPIGQLTYLLTLPPFGFYWFLLSEADDWPSHHTPAPEPMPEYQTIVMRHALPEAIAAGRSMIEREILPPYLAKRRVVRHGRTRRCARCGSH